VSLSRKVDGKEEIHTFKHKFATYHSTGGAYLFRPNGARRDVGTSVKYFPTEQNRTELRHLLLFFLKQKTELRSLKSSKDLCSNLFKSE